MCMEDPKDGVPLVYTGYKRPRDASDSQPVVAKYFLRKAQNRPEPFLITKWWRAAKRNEYAVAMMGCAILGLLFVLTLLFP